MIAIEEIQTLIHPSIIWIPYISNPTYRWFSYIHTYQTSRKLFKSEIDIVSIWQKSDIGDRVDGKCADCDGDCDDDDDNTAFYDDDDDDDDVDAIRKYTTCIPPLNHTVEVAASLPLDCHCFQAA